MADGFYCYCGIYQRVAVFFLPTYCCGQQLHPNEIPPTVPPTSPTFSPAYPFPRLSNPASYPSACRGEHGKPHTAKRTPGGRRSTNSCSPLFQLQTLVVYIPHHMLFFCKISDWYDPVVSFHACRFAAAAGSTAGHAGLQPPRNH